MLDETQQMLINFRSVEIMSSVVHSSLVTHFTASSILAFSLQLMRNERDGVYERIYRVDEKRREIDISIPADVLLQSNSGVLTPRLVV